MIMQKKKMLTHRHTVVTVKIPLLDISINFNAVNERHQFLPSPPITLILPPSP